MKRQLDDLGMFLAVVEARSFTGAASMLGVTTSAVSQSVSRLERLLGQKLLFRSTRSLSLTEAGSALLPKCREIRRIQEEVVALFDGEQMAMQDTLTVTAPHALCRPLVMPAISEFLNNQPMLSIRLLASDERVNLIDKQVDLAIRVGTDAQQSAYRSRIGYLTECLFASRDYVDARGMMPTALQDLASWQHIGSEWQGTPLVYKRRKEETLSVVPRIRCSTVPDTIAAVSQGLGVALLPDIAVTATDEETGNFVRLFEISKSPIFALHHYEKQAPAKVRGFTATLKSGLAQLNAN